MAYHLCNSNFQSNYAKLAGVSGRIEIKDYLNGKYGDNKKITCIPHNHELVAVNAVQRRAHFRHKHNSDVDGSPMTEWHSEWQSNFPDTEVCFENRVDQLRNRRADVVLPEFKQILEIQHSKINSGEVNERIKDYALHGHTVKWIIDSQESIIVKNLDKRRILEFTKNYWLYQSFLNCDLVYYDIDGLIYQVKPSLVKVNQIDVCEPRLKEEFIEALKTNNDIWKDDEQPPQCYLYLRQQGAGSGKTYGMMQLLNNDNEIANYKYIVLITKQHSAVKVMLDEFMDQYNKGVLTNIEELEKTINNKQYIIKYKHKLTNIECKVIFGTVDSFTYSLGDSSKSSAADTFTGIVESIRDGTIKTGFAGSMKYANVNPILNKEMLIMIDEAQDLTETYGEAFLQIVRSKYTNLCLVGDILQSITYKKNALMYLLRIETVVGMKVIKSDIINTVRRFSDPTLIKFVNSMIPFNSYGLPEMIPALEVEETPCALTVFEAKTVYADKLEDSEQVVEEVEKIMELFKEEVESNNRIPEDFIIITPFTNKNPLVEGLQIAVNSYWKELMQTDITYIENVKLKHPYWKDVDTNQYRRYAIFHKSQDGSSINLNESNNATRIVSIHSSKGDGRKVAFVIGVTQSALQVFSEIANNIIYDSLFQVSITRQKEKLYFRLEAINDDIHNKIKNSSIDIQVGNTEFDILRKTVKLSKIINSIQELTDTYQEFYKNLISKIELPLFSDETDKEKKLIDMGDHNIRYGSMFMNIIVHCCNFEFKTRSNVKRQFSAILNEVKNAPIREVNKWQKYVEILKDNSNYDDKKIVKYIPLFNLKSKRGNIEEYEAYYKIIRSTIDRVIAELESLNKTTLDYFCPYESVILYYMIECIQNGKYQSITISDVYNITDIYSKSFDSLALGHEKCGCKKHFINKNIGLTEYEKKYKEYLYNHFDRLSHVNNLLDDFDNKHPSINWLYSHPINLGKGDDITVYNSKGIIGYDNINVYNVYIKPQFNELNYNEFLVCSILDTYLLCNLNKDSENFKRFENKKILSIVISLNKETIYEINWTNIVQEKENKEFIKQLLYDKLYDMFSVKHKQYYDTFMNIIENMSDKGPIKILERCEKFFSKAKRIPEYLVKSWSFISTEIENCEEKEEQDEILIKYKKEKSFIKLFDNKLKRSLKGFLDLIED